MTPITSDDAIKLAGRKKIELTTKSGRKTKSIEQLEDILFFYEHKKHEFSVEEICKQKNISKSTFYRVVKLYNSKIEAVEKQQTTST
jgi:DNA invertase Pin-like site-specific DNA recombinase